MHQKAVGMRLGLDIASITLKKHADVIVLVSGDSNFVPAVKLARREGAQVFLLTSEHQVADEVREHADNRVISLLPAHRNSCQTDYKKLEFQICLVLSQDKFLQNHQIAVRR